MLYRGTHVVHALSHLSLSLNKNNSNKMSNRGDWIIIGISGVTCGGKTTLANRLKDALSPVYIFNQDYYFYPDDSPHHVKCKGLDHNNYDILSSLDMERMHDDVLKTLEGENRAHMQDEERCEGKLEMVGKKFLVMEGFTVLNYEPLNELCDLRYYLVLEYGACFARRSLRLYEPPDVEGYFDTCVWPEHLQYKAQIEQDPRVSLLSGEEPGVAARVLADLRARGASPV